MCHHFVYVLQLCVICVHECYLYVNCLYVSLCVLRGEGSLIKDLPLLRSQNAVCLIVRCEHVHGCERMGVQMDTNILRKRDFCSNIYRAS